MELGSPHTYSVDISDLATGGSTSVAASEVSCAISIPKTVSFRVDWRGAKVTSCFFQPPLAQACEPKAPSPVSTAAAKSTRRPVQRTRIRPPKDIVRLEDRLFFLLQPPLEQLIQTDRLEFPFEPFSYQFEGIAFLFPRHSALLADEMGLGKTMQAITSIRLLARRGEIRNVLLICPKPLVTNWQREFAMWAPELPVVVVTGGPERRRWIWDQTGAVVKLANYELLLRDESLLNEESREFDLVVLDEAQRIKNPRSSTHQIACQLRRTRAWALTGTPVENSSDDLVGIFDFLMPGYLSPAMTPRHLGESVSDFLLRRTKDAVLKDLPPKLYRDPRIQLTPQQWATYHKAEQDGVLRLSEMGGEITIQHVFELVLRLKQICNHDPATGESAKMEQLVADLDEVVASRQKAIVFSQWVQTLTHLADRLDQFGTLEYHGKIPMARRDAVIEQFRQDPDKHVLLMSYGAGSVGLNLQFASYVFLFDRWWNPAVEDQAINRAHRIGVAGPVTVTRMIAEGTIEERIHEVLEEKRQLMHTILSGNGAPGSISLNQDEIFGLFGLHPRREQAA